MPWNAGPASVTPRCSGQSPRSASMLVGLDHDDRVVVLDRDLEVVEVVLLEQARPPTRPTRPAPRRWPCRTSRISRGSSEPALTPIRIETPASLAARGDLLDLVVELADVARVDAHRGTAGVDRGEDVLGLEVDVGDDRDLAVRAISRQRVGVVLGGAGHPDDVAAGGGELGDLLQRGVDVGRRGGAHRLHGDGRVAADLDLADLDLARLAPRARARAGAGRAYRARPSCVKYLPRAGRPSWSPRQPGCRTARPGRRAGRQPPSLTGLTMSA